MSSESESNTEEPHSEAQEVAEQAERYLQLSLRCHEQNWSAVHALAEQIALHKRLAIEREEEKKRKKAVAAKDEGGDDNQQKEQVANNDCKMQSSSDMNISNEEAAVVVPAARIKSTSKLGESNLPTEIVSVNTFDKSPVNEEDIQQMDDAHTTSKNNRSGEENITQPQQQQQQQQITKLPPTSPRLLSTCLGTASPLAWTCRYSAPSSTVKLVLGLDLSAVRRCLPQLGTPLHEIVGRPRPLHKMPLKRGRWSTLLIGNDANNNDSRDVGIQQKTDNISSTTSKRTKKPSKGGKKKKKKILSRNGVLKGLREWRRTVRTLIQSDETLLKEEDSKSQSALTNQENHHPSIRATLAQDADGNTPLHFMVRGAAAPAFGMGRWQARHDVEKDDESSSGDENDAEDDDKKLDTRNSSWDGVRWCMEAHIRRVERRAARHLRQMNTCRKDIEMDTSDKDPDERVARRVASVRIDSSSRLDAVMSNAEKDDRKVAAEPTTKLPIKRKSLELDGDRSRKKDTSASTLKNVESSDNTTHRRRTSRARAKKYLDEDEYQDCLYDPLLGAVRDLVYSCPEAVGVPDLREYEETPLIVALKSSIYVVMEPNQGFQLPGGGGGGNGGGRGLAVGKGFNIFSGGVGGGFPFSALAPLINNNPFFPDDEAMMAVLRGHERRASNNRMMSSPSPLSVDATSASESGMGEVNCQDNKTNKDDGSTCSSVSDDSVDFHGEDDPRYDAFISSANEQEDIGTEHPGVQMGLVPRGRPRYDYQTALEYRIFCLVRIMLDAFPRAACLLISDYTPLHSAVFHGRCPDTIRLLLDAEARFLKTNGTTSNQKDTSTRPEPCPTLEGPAMLCCNARGELPLHFASMRNECARTIRLLAESDPRSVLVRDASGRTPLRWLWIRFVDGLMDRFGGRDTQEDLAFHENETVTSNFPSRSILGGFGADRDVFAGDFERSTDQFMFDTEYLQRTRNIDRTVDFLRMRHVPSSFESIEYIAADHAITVLLKLKYLQQRRMRQLASFDSSSNNELSADVSMSAKEEFILYAFEKFTYLIHAANAASDAEECARESNMDRLDFSYASARKKLWQTLHQGEPGKQYLVHGACRGSRASCPAAVALICIKLFSDQLHICDSDGQLPLHKVALRGIGWEPPGSSLVESRHASLADETLTLLKEVIVESHKNAPSTFDNNKQLPLHCAIDSLVTSIVMGKDRRRSLQAEARISLQKHRHTHVSIALEILSELLQANSSALQERDGKSGLFPFMQAALPHVRGDCAVVKYTSDLGRRPGFVARGNASVEKDVEENDDESEADHITIIYHLLREDPSVID